MCVCGVCIAVVLQVYCMYTIKSARGTKIKVPCTWVRAFLHVFLCISLFVPFVDVLPPSTTTDDHNHNHNHDDTVGFALCDVIATLLVMATMQPWSPCYGLRGDQCSALQVGQLCSEQVGEQHVVYQIEGALWGLGGGDTRERTNTAKIPPPTHTPPHGLPTLHWVTVALLNPPCTPMPGHVRAASGTTVTVSLPRAVATASEELRRARSDSVVLGST